MNPTIAMWSLKLGGREVDEYTRSGKAASRCTRTLARACVIGSTSVHPYVKWLAKQVIIVKRMPRLRWGSKCILAGLHECAYCANSNKHRGRNSQHLRLANFLPEFTNPHPWPHAYQCCVKPPIPRFRQPPTSPRSGWPPPTRVSCSY